MPASPTAHAAAAGAAPPSRVDYASARWRALTLSRADVPRWSRPGLAAVLLLAAFLTIWGLSKNGYSNEYYAAAVRSATESWNAMFFGSLDPSSFITVDKPPLSIWLMGLSTRVLGFSSFAMLLPQALCTVGAVALLHATVRRVAGPAAALAAALAFALTPITIAIGRVNNPDALLILLLVGSAYLTVRAVESGKTKHLAWAGTLVGLAFMTKMLQGWMVLPALAITYFAFGPGSTLRRTGQLAITAVVTAAVSAAWPLAVTLWPGSTPYIGGSTNGSVWDLILGYNGLGRLTGGEGAGGGGANFGGTAGWLRMFNEQVGAQIAWLLPLAAVGLLAGLWMTRRAPRTDLRRAGLVLFGIWGLVHVVIFSTAQGTFHPYYTSAMAPAIAALSGIGVIMLAKAARTSWTALAVLDLSVAGTALLSLELMSRATDAPGWAKVAVPFTAFVAIVLSPLVRSERPSARRLVAVAAVAGSIALLAGPASYSFANLGRSLNGNNVLAGPAGASSGGGMGGGMVRGGQGGPGGQMGTPPSGAMSAQPGGMGGGGVSDEVISYLQANQGSAKYLLAATGSQTTASIIIETGANVVTIGGFSGSDPAPTVDQLAQMVADGELRYVLIGGQGGGRGGSSEITTWVQEHGTAVTDVTASSGTLYAVSA